MPDASKTTVCRWCKGAKMTPQMDAPDEPCPVCKGSGADPPTTRLPNWKSSKFRDGVFVGAAMVLLPLFLWVIVHG